MADVIQLELPAGWAESKDANGRSYFYNKQDGTTQWTRPTAAASANPLPPATPPPNDQPLPPGWSEAVDPRTGKPYYHNQQNGEVVWVRPTAPGAVPPGWAGPGARNGAGWSHALLSKEGMRTEKTSCLLISCCFPTVLGQLAAHYIPDFVPGTLMKLVMQRVPENLQTDTCRKVAAFYWILLFIVVLFYLISFGTTALLLYTVYGLVGCVLLMRARAAVRTKHGIAEMATCGLGGFQRPNPLLGKKAWYGAAMEDCCCACWCNCCVASQILRQEGYGIDKPCDAEFKSTASIPLCPLLTELPLHSLAAMSSSSRSASRRPSNT